MSNEVIVGINKDKKIGLISLKLLMITIILEKL